MKYDSKAATLEAIGLFRFRGPVPYAVFNRIPELKGRAIRVIYRPKLTAWKGKLLSKSHKGDLVYAGCFLRKRRIVLDEQMLRTPRVLERIFVHEIFHFAWPRLGNPLRSSFEELISREIGRGAGGELGWSAESLKLKLTPEDRTTNSRRWRYYLCESFCDTAGWFFGTAKRYSEMTLPGEFRDVRNRWFRENLVGRPLSI